MHFDRRFAVVLSASLLWALLVSSMFYRLAAGSGGRTARVAEKQMVVAVRPLLMGVVIDRDAVRLAKVPEKLFPVGAFSRVEEVLDRPVVAAIQADEAILEARLAARGSGPGLGPLIPSGMRAIAVRVNDVVGVAGFILPGMRVDVLVTGRPPNSNDTMSRTVLQNVAVLSAGQTLQSDGKSQSILTPVVTLLVNPQEAEALTLANTEGRIQLVLRNSTDRDTTVTAGRQTRDLYGSLPAAGPSPAAPSREPAARAVRRAVAAPPPVTSVAAEADRMVVMNGRVTTVAEFSRGGRVK